MLQLATLSNRYWLYYIPEMQLKLMVGVYVTGLYSQLKLRIDKKVSMH